MNKMTWMTKRFSKNKFSPICITLNPTKSPSQFVWLILLWQMLFFYIFDMIGWRNYLEFINASKLTTQKHQIGSL